MRTLLAGLIDYAGLFPPASLGMGAACENFARESRGGMAWALGRFVCPASRLDELSRAAAVMMPGTAGTSGYREHADVMEPWRISAIIDSPLEASLGAIAAFNERHGQEDQGRAVVDMVEVKVESAGQIDAIIDALPEDLYPFFEFPHAEIERGDARGLIAALAGEPVAAKIRTGGITPEAFPSPAAVARFIVACAAARVPFKATAGLHHAIRGEHPLTYEPRCPRGVMHGFLNVFVAATMARTHQLDADRTRAMLEESRAEAFHFTSEGVRWNGLFAETAQIAKARESFCLSYGSCSFDEPIAELRALGLL